MTELKKGLSGAELKYLAMLFMLIDHIAAAYDPVSSSELLAWMHHIGRLAFPLFCFTLVEGAVHTSNMRNFISRVAVFAVISEVPFDMLMGGTFIWKRNFNVMWTLMLGLIAIYLWNKLIADNDGETEAKSAIKTVVAVFAICGIAVLAQVAHTDYGAAGFGLVLTIYIFRGRIAERDISSALFLSSLGTLEMWGLPSIALFHTYNGERGRQTKWLFYIFYPTHLFILGIIRMHLLS